MKTKKTLKISEKLKERNTRLEKKLKADGHVVKVLYKYADGRVEDRTADRGKKVR